MPPFFRAFIAAEHDRRHQRVVQVDRRGKVEQEFACDSLPLDLHLLANGHLLVNLSLSIVELDPSFREVWRYRTEQVAFFSAQQVRGRNILLGDTGRSRIAEISSAGTMVRSFEFPVPIDCSPHYNMFRLIRPIDEQAERLLVACFHDRKIAEFSWDGKIHWQVPVEGPPYMPLRLSSGNTLVSLGPTGRIIEVDPAGEVVWRYDMWDDNRLERGWIAGLTALPDGGVIYSDSKHDRLVEIDRGKRIRGVFQDRDVLLHPSTHVILPQ